MFKCTVLCTHHTHPSIDPFPRSSRKPEPIKYDFLPSPSQLLAPTTLFSVLVNLTGCFVQEGSSGICPSGSSILVLLDYSWTVLGTEPRSIMYTGKCSAVERGPAVPRFVLEEVSGIIEYGLIVHAHTYFILFILLPTWLGWSCHIYLFISKFNFSFYIYVYFAYMQNTSCIPWPLNARRGHWNLWSYGYRQL